MRYKRILFYLLFPFLLISLLAIWLRKPLLYSNWDKDVRVLAEVELSADQSSLTLRGIRNWSYGNHGPVDETIYFDQEYKFKDLEKAWFYLQPLDATGLIAHTFVVFEFKGDYGKASKLGLSVETRRKVGQEYSLLKGALRGFMVTHIWATESDLTSRRTDYLGYKLEKYQLQLKPKHLKVVLKAFLNRTQDLHSHPKFYNTFTNNCTNSLAKYINQAHPKSIPWHHSFIFTGKSARYLRSLGYVE